MALLSIFRIKFLGGVVWILLLRSITEANGQTNESNHHGSIQFSRSLQLTSTDALVNPFLDGTDPVWWETYRAQFGKRAKKCIDVPQLPVNGTVCPSKKINEYSCFFGDQTCPADNSQHFQIKCDCSLDRIWNCAEYDACGTTQREPFTTCPEKHPLDFPFKPTCKSDFLICNYGRQACCGESFPTSSCECIDGEFVCFNHETCQFRDCEGALECPTVEPTFGASCDHPNLATCAYGERQCCGHKWKSRVHHCFSNQWDVVTDILYNPCECDTPSPVPAPLPPLPGLPTPQPTLEPFPNTPDTCQCQSDLDCQKPKCSFDPFTSIGVCVSAPLPSATPSISFPSMIPSLSPSTSFPSMMPSFIPSVIPSEVPSTEPSALPSAGPSRLPSADPSMPPSDMPSSIPSGSPTVVTSDVPSLSPSTCMCMHPKKHVPSDCEFNILIDLMETNVKARHALLPRWLRLAFHDAGTFNQHTGEGGANGCLLTHPPMRRESENQFLEDPIDVLQSIKNQWESHPAVCLNVSSADMIQFAGLFSTVRQSVTNVTVGPGLTIGKINRLKEFQWGRPDEVHCRAEWTANLPGFQTGHAERPLRCLMAGKEIKDKMMDRNGFTAREAAALIGAHSIGLIRFSFGELFRGPWVKDGRDDATPSGPVFNNAYHDFLENEIEAETAEEFADNMNPFKTDFGTFNWFTDKPPDHSPDSEDKEPRLDHLDTDLALAFPSQDEDVHPNFHAFTQEFANSNLAFLQAFFPALEKMSKLGVKAPLFHCGVCDSCAPPVITPLQIIESLLSLGNATATADAVQNQRQQKRAEEIQLLTTPNITASHPTLSAAPSMSPSTGPSSSPTDNAPSTRPTGSGVPSTGPSGIPSLFDMPTGTPTTPSVSSAPSAMDAPSVVPSLSRTPSRDPTFSSSPSFGPSAPSVSSIPSFRPSISTPEEKQAEDAKQFFEENDGDGETVDFASVPSTKP